jgi:hypothetical protein
MTATPSAGIDPGRDSGRSYRVMPLGSIGGEWVSLAGPLQMPRDRGLHLASAGADALPPPQEAGVCAEAPDGHPGPGGMPPRRAQT